MPLQLLVRILFAGSAVLALSGCQMLRDAPDPIAVVTLQRAPVPPAKTLVVFLPGVSDSARDFHERGVVAALQRTGAPVDVVAVDAHFGYYVRGSIVRRLQADVVLPARQRGYTRIVAVGVSLGGLGALMTERAHRGSFDAIVLVAPYLGAGADILAECEMRERLDRTAFGGAPAKPRASRTALGRDGHTLPETWLLTGRHDRYYEAHQALARLLPADHVIVGDGGHHWGTWIVLWERFCAMPDLFQATPSGERLATAGSH